MILVSNIEAFVQKYLLPDIFRLKLFPYWVLCHALFPPRWATNVEGRINFQQGMASI